MVSQFEEQFACILNANPEIPEKAFVEVFLDGLITNDERITEEWVRIAGNRFMPVNVMSDDGKNKLFTVPPLVRKHRAHSDIPVSDLVEYIKTRRNVHKVNGDNIAYGVFTDLEFEVPVEEEDAHAWYLILKRYNKLKAVETVIQSTSTAVDGGYEEW